MLDSITTDKRIKELAEWKAVEDFTRYEVSEDGRFWDTKMGVEVKQVLSGNPQYFYVNLNRGDGQRKLIRSHRLVAKAFVAGWSDVMDIVDHIDRNKLNNHYTNLRWTDRSGNQRNLENSLFIGTTHLKDFVLRYNNPDAAYSYLYTYITKGFSDEEVVEKYERHLRYGTNLRMVEWEGEQVYLKDLCIKYNRDYDLVVKNLRQGWDVWNSLFSVRYSHPYSVEVTGESVGYWFPSRDYMVTNLGIGRDKLSEMLSDGDSYEDIISYEQLNYLRQTVLGVTGTIKELCKSFGKTEASVKARMQNRRMSLEEALTAEPERVKKVTINGVANSPKKWFEHFGLRYQSVRKYRDRNKASFEQILHRFGVDTSNMTIEYGD